MEDLTEVKREIVKCQFCNRQIEHQELEEHTQFCSGRITQSNAGQRFLTQKFNQTNQFTPNLNQQAQGFQFTPFNIQNKFPQQFQNSQNFQNQNQSFLQVQKEERTKFGQQLEQKQNNINQSQMIVKSDEQEQMQKDLENFARSQPINNPNPQFMNSQFQPPKFVQNNNMPPPFKPQQQNFSKIEFKPIQKKENQQQQQQNIFQTESLFQPQKNQKPNDFQSIFQTEQVQEKKEKQNQEQFLFTTENVQQQKLPTQFQPQPFQQNTKQQANQFQFQQPSSFPYSQIKFSPNFQQQQKQPENNQAFQNGVFNQIPQQQKVQQQQQIKLNPLSQQQQVQNVWKPPQQQPPQQQSQFNSRFEPKQSQFLNNFQQFGQINTSESSQLPQNQQQQQQQKLPPCPFNFQNKPSNPFNQFQQQNINASTPNDLFPPNQQQQQQVFPNPIERSNFIYRPYQSPDVLACFRGPQQNIFSTESIPFSRLNIFQNIRDTYSRAYESDSDSDNEGLRNFDPEKEYSDIEVNRMTPEQVYEYFTIKDAKMQSGYISIENLGQCVIPPETNDKDICVICIEVLEETEGKQIVQLVCKHLFHYECIEKWLKRSKKCPLCKAYVDL